MIRATTTSRKKFWDFKMVIIGETHKQNANEGIWGRQCVDISTFHLFPLSPLLPLIS